MTSAGEVEQFVYCAHNWYLARHGATGKGEGSAHGIDGHAKAGRAEKRIEHEKREYRRAWAWFFRGVAMATSSTILLFEVLYLKSPPHEFLFITTTAVLVGASAGLMLLGIINERRYKRHQKEAHMVPGRLVSSDLAGPGPLLEDPAWGLKGRPDQVIDTKSGFVPVEIKTGKTPQHPHPNHAQQLGCYLRLVEVATGKPPEYGLVNYPGGVFRVAWDDKLKGQLRATLARINEARSADRADRDHEQPGRCRGCARRDACEQKLA